LQPLDRLILATLFRLGTFYMTNFNDNRIPKDTSLWTKKRLKIQEINASKSTNSHRNTPSKKHIENPYMQLVLRSAISQSCEDMKEWLVIYSINPLDSKETPPSHDIENLIYYIQKANKNEIIKIQKYNESLPTDDRYSIPSKNLNLKSWRDIPQIHKPYYYQLALSELEERSNHEYKLVPFVFNESKALTAHMNELNSDRIDYVRDYLQKGLNKALGRNTDDKVAFWFAFETAQVGQPHYQGSLLIKPSEARVARDVFYKLNIKMTPREKLGALRFRSGKRKECCDKYSPLYTDLNWADYNLKEIGVTRNYYISTRVDAASQPLIKHTKDYYNRLRLEFNNAKI
jgi:hypothetical protein